MTSTIAKNLGFIFEDGFNIGVLTYLKQNNLGQKFVNLYISDLQKLKFNELVKKILAEGQINSQEERHMAKKWITFCLQKGFFCGLNFLKEYIKAIEWNPEKTEIVYYQCNFANFNSMGIINKTDEEIFNNYINQFNGIDNINYWVKKYQEKGEFLRGDCLMLLKYRDREWRIVSVDLSIFSLQDKDIINLDDMEVLRRLLMRDINYLRSKSVFSKLSIDSQSGVEYSPTLKNYFTAFKYDDKETSKLIQAGGYAYSFYNFLRENNILSELTNVMINVVGYSDRNLSTMSITPKNLDLLKNCYEIYKNEGISGKNIHEAREKVLKQIQTQVKNSFNDGRKLIEAIFKMQTNKINIVCHQEMLPDFMNSVGDVDKNILESFGLLQLEKPTLRNVHAELIKQELSPESPSKYVFLTGNPGIGKTTAIATFLKEYQEEGFLFFYVSPRKQVNLDIIEKFKDKNNQFSSDNLICLNTDSDIIKNNGGKATVEYQSLINITGDYPVDFMIMKKDDEEENNAQKSKRKDAIQRKSSDELTASKHKSPGVIYSISEGIYQLMKQKISNQIVATCAIQSLKKVRYGGDTLKHLENIFKDAYNSHKDQVNETKMKVMSSKIKHLFIMIDEITGDDAGTEFLHQIKEICQKYKLFDSATGFNTKIIIADASIVNKDVIIQHLANQNAEPDKIYFRSIKNQDIAPVSTENFEFFKQNATVINTNSYPAKSLKLNYKLIVESVKFDEKAELKQKTRLIENVQNEIFKDLEKLLKNPEINQVIVYIQDKKRLAELIEGIKKKNNQFEKNKDYLEVHANISRTEKKEINKYKDKVKVIFMTASGSRGLSFPKAKHILVEIPRFSIEKNLMEIIQVIYRGRGDNDIDKQDKELFFYLADQAIYYKEDEGDKELELNESKLSLLNILLLLKAAILTRIAGKAQIGINDFLIIPIGGKSIYSVGEGFSSNMTSLINQLKSEYRSRPADIILKNVYENLQHLLGMGHYQLTGNSTEKNQEESYLVLRETLADQFPEMCITLDKLLDFPKSEAGYIVGNLLLVNNQNNKLHESYEMKANQHIEKYATEQILSKMYVISNSNQYPDSLKSLIKDGIELIKKLRENLEITQTFKQELQQMDQYYAIPLFAFIAGETMANYFTKMRDRVGYSPQENEEEVSQFRDILSTYIRTIYPVQNILPIGSDYAEFPFVLFRSYNLTEIRQRMFTDKYLLTSTELNVINMILAQ